MEPWTLILLAWAAAAAVMAVLWLIQRHTGDAGIVDVAWALGVGLTVAFFAYNLDGYAARRVLVAALAGIWALRLGVYLLVRVVRLPEDGRYRRLRETWGARVQTFFFAFFQIQAAWCVLFALPMLIACTNPDPTLGWLDFAGAALWLISVVGASAADRQLGRFRVDPANRGKVCQAGLWRYSRHPNYFFEWLQWWAWVLIGWNAPLGWLTLLGPAVMLVFLLKITGIPPTEAQAVASRGEAYRRYQRTTSAFFPWPPKNPEVERC